MQSIQGPHAEARVVAMKNSCPSPLCQQSPSCHGLTGGSGKRHFANQSRVCRDFCRLQSLQSSVAGASLPDSLREVLIHPADDLKENSYFS